MTCPICKKELLCGCKSCIDNSIKKINTNYSTKHYSLLLWLSDGELQACSSCGHTMHCDHWLDK